MAPPPSPSFLLDWRVPYVPLFAMICVSVVTAELLGLRLPSRALRPSPKPTATDGTPIATLRAVAPTERPVRRDFKEPSLAARARLDPPTRRAPRRLRRDGKVSALAGLLGRVHRHGD